MTLNSNKWRSKTHIGDPKYMGKGDNNGPVMDN